MNLYKKGKGRTYNSACQGRRLPTRSAWRSREAFDATGEERTEEQRRQCTGRLRLPVVLYKECYGPDPMVW